MSKLGRVSPPSKSRISIIGLGKNKESGASFWGIPSRGGMRQPKQLLLLIRCGLTWLRYVIFTTLILCIFGCNFLFHISMILTFVILSFQGNNKAAALRKKGCPDYEKLKQLFALNTATGSLQISSNTPAPDSDEEHVLEEELANEARKHIVPSWMMMIATFPTWRA